MVEPIKHPKVVLDRQIKYLTVRSTPPPEVDLSSDLYSEQTESEDQLKWLVAGSVGGGTMKAPDPGQCISGIFFIMMSIINTLYIFHPVFSWTKDELKEAANFPVISESLILLFSILVSFPKPPPLPFPLPAVASIPFAFFLLHAAWWTPLGMVLIPDVWKDCGSPGSGLGKKLKTLAAKAKASLQAPPRPVLAPATFTAIDPKTASESLTATALVGIVGATILYLVTLPESVAASIALPILQADETNQSI